MEVHHYRNLSLELLECTTAWSAALPDK